MSKNFELLQQIEKNDVFHTAEETVQAALMAPNQNGLKKGPTNNEITKLVQRLFSQTGNANAPKVVSFSGIARDDRSSLICARTAEALSAQVDVSICIVDANLWSPRLHVHFSIANSNGLTEALATKDPIRNFGMPLCGENLWLFPSGSRKPIVDPFGERFRECFAEMREVFDYVLISAPSLSREAEATLIGQLADGVVLIVEANRTRRETLRHAKEQLESAHVRLLGAVLDQRTFPIPEKLYWRL